MNLNSICQIIKVICATPKAETDRLFFARWHN